MSSGADHTQRDPARSSTPINASTKISALLANYPRALDVLTTVSPAFTKLKNPMLRRVFAPRVTIEQAASIGGVSPSALLAALHESCGDATTTTSQPPFPTETMQPSTMPAHIASAAEGDLVLLDVREDIKSGQDPFGRIMRTVKALHPGQILHLVNSFEPVPLYGVLGNRGLAHWSEENAGLWHIYFYEKNGSEQTAAGGPAEQATEARSSSREIIELDVAGLEPPEPMRRILIALGTLAPNAALQVHHHREPMLLYDQLKQRGFAWVTTKLGPNEYRIVISREAE